MRRFISVANALGALHVLGAFAQDAPAPDCVGACTNQVRNDFTKFTCTSAEDAACLCPNADFSNGIRDCATATCGATDTDVYNWLKPDFCLNFPPPSPSGAEPSTTAAAPATTSETAPATTEAPTTTEAPATTSAAPETTEKAASESSAATTSSAPETETTASAAATTSSVSSTASSTSASETPAVDGSKDGDETEEDSESGLSEGAKIGIAVGVTVAAIAIAALCICLFMRKRKQRPQPRQQPIIISHPLPGSGRTPSGRGRDSYEKYDADIEMTSNRYDDMPPRQVPRTMV